MMDSILTLVLEKDMDLYKEGRNKNVLGNKNDIRNHLKCLQKSKNCGSRFKLPVCPWQGVSHWITNQNIKLCKSNTGADLSSAGKGQLPPPHPPPISVYSECGHHYICSVNSTSLMSYLLCRLTQKSWCYDALCRKAQRQNVRSEFFYHLWSEVWGSA